VFAGFGIFFVVLGLYALTLQTLQPDHWQFLALGKDAVDYIGGTFRWLGMVSIALVYLRSPSPTEASAAGIDGRGMPA
jgi:hypothetical protein